MEENKPKISGDQTLIKIHYAGICGTDKQFADGTREIEQSILGHEAVGSIVAIGKDVISTRRVGDLVVFLPHSKEHPSEILGHNIAGVFSKYIVLDSQKLDELTVVCDGSEDDEILALTEPLAASIFSLELLSTKSNIRRLGIIGIGTIGCLIALTAMLIYDEPEIYCFHNNKENIESHILYNYPNIHFIDIRDNSLIYDLNGSLDSLVICTPKNDSIDVIQLAVELASDHAIIDLLSGYNKYELDIQGTVINTEKIRQKNICGDKFVERTIIGSKEIYLTGHRGVSKAHMEKSIGLLSSHKYIYHNVINNKLTPEEAVEYLNSISDGYSSEFLKTIIKF
ncbi:alcohol dehydrogenase catalytic domain-containing protein [Vibrio sp. OCN044]|uniref:Alcohol dehydrogenase catalytic domain-containing protein n=1 Tax=Vibrio tetraodonis subsp. pristinus TaxID=2695891 RepID=A0A6L8LUZ6_9VIBR|nr:alcohol dehydrogenase catalytic domain-containing protein [Vibrio tetraodonis]MYM59303.1 alcohol dehydrogenase catalytic domain-containing protein [Vibrio tetraodonis subsp. pristinus]